MTNTAMNTTTPAASTPALTPEVHIRVSRDDDASRISAVLEALGYTVLRQLDEGDAPARLRWAVNRLARRHKLTSREQDILELVLEGRSNSQIGRQLEISRATVKWHMHNLFAKTNTGNRESLLRLALQLGSGGEPIVEPLPPRSPEPEQASVVPALTPPGKPPAASTRPQSAKRDGHWSAPEDVTARVDFDQPRVPSADSIPSKSWY